MLMEVIESDCCVKVPWKQKWWLDAMNIWILRKW
jgi:hypothetical protein